MRRILYTAILLPAILAGLLGGCGSVPPSETDAPKASQKEEAVVMELMPESVRDESKLTYGGDIRDIIVPHEAQPSESWIVTDSAGRNVEIPRHLTRVAPASLEAQLILYTINPGLLAGVVQRFDESAPYIEDAYRTLPVLGHLRDDASRGPDSLVEAAPEIIVEVGESHSDIGEEMDALRDWLGIPVVFVEASTETLSGAYTILGDILMEQERCSILSAYAAEAVAGNAGIPREKQVSCYIGYGENGLHPNTERMTGIRNVAESSPEGEISFDQLAGWNPDVIVLEQNAYEKSMVPGSPWQTLGAAKNGKIFEMPVDPYSWFGEPLSANRLIGVKWLNDAGDISGELSEFYKLFYRYG